MRQGSRDETFFYRSQSNWEAVYFPGLFFGSSGHCSQPDHALPLDSARRENTMVRSVVAHRSIRRHHDTRALSITDDNPRNLDGVLRSHHCSAGRLWELLFAASNWRRGYGLPRSKHAFVLDHLPGFDGFAAGLLRGRRRAVGRVDGLSSALRIRTHRRARAGIRNGLLDCIHCAVFYRIADGIY